MPNVIFPSVFGSLYIVLLFFYWMLVLVITGFVPGYLILRKFFHSLAPIYQLWIYVGFGCVLWVVQGIVVGIVHMRWLTYIYVAILLFYFYVYRKHILKFFTVIKRGLFRIPWWVYGVFIIGVIGQCIQSIPSGFLFPDGWKTVIADDALWHIGLTGELVRRFPPNEPGLAGTLLTNYHYFSNLWIAEYVRVFSFPLITLQFLFCYSLLSILLGILTYIFVRRAGFSQIGAVSAVWIQYFASDCIYLVSYISSHVFVWNVHPLEDGTMFLENPPRAMSIVMVLFGLILLQEWIRRPAIVLGIITSVIFGLVVGFKVHTGFMITAGLCGFGLYAILKKKYKYLIIPIGSFIVSAFVYFSVNGKAGLPVFAPFEMSRMFIVQPLLHTIWMELRRRVYMDHSNTIRILQMDIIMLVIFILAQFGIRNAGWLGWKSAVARFGLPLTILLGCGLIGSFGFGTLFIQPIAWADIFNSYLAGSLMLSVFAASWFDAVFQKKNVILSSILCIVIGACTLPRFTYRMIKFVKDFQGVKPIITRDEIDAMDFLKKNGLKDAIVLVQNTGHCDTLWSFTPAFTQRDSYLSGMKILDSHEIPYESQARIARIIFESTSSGEMADAFTVSHISYVYYYEDHALSKIQQELPLRLFYKNPSMTIYEYKQ